MAVTKIDGSRQIKDGSIADAQIASGAAIATSKLADAANFILRGGSVAFTANQSMGSNRLTNVADPTSAQDAATKAYVDATAQGLDVKQSVRAVSTTNLTLSGTQTVDGVSLVANDRILVAGQTTASQNGIYVVAAGAWARSSDADVSADVTAGMYAFVEEGTVYADTGWILTTNGAITLNTTNLTFTQFTGAASIVGGAGLTKTGNTLDVVAADNSLQVNADSVQVKIADASIEVVAGGIRAKAGTSGQVYIANASGILTPVTLSGDATVTAAGVVTVANQLKETNIVTRETPSGSVNGSNTTFTLANTPTAGSEEVYLNGILQEPGAGNDYTISTNTITYLTAPVTGDKIRVNYRK